MCSLCHLQYATLQRKICLTFSTRLLTASLARSLAHRPRPLRAIWRSNILLHFRWELSPLLGQSELENKLRLEFVKHSKISATLE